MEPESLSKSAIISVMPRAAGPPPGPLSNGPPQTPPAVTPLESALSPVTLRAASLTAAIGAGGNGIMTGTAAALALIVVLVSGALAVRGPLLGSLVASVAGTDVSYSRFAQDAAAASAVPGTPSSYVSGSATSSLLAGTSTAGTATSSQRITYVYTYPVIERIVATTSAAVTEAELTSKLNQLDNKLVAEILSVSASLPGSSGALAPLSVQQFAPSQRIDQLSGVTIINSTIDTASIPSLSGSYLSITNAGNATLSGTLTVGSCVGCGGGSDSFTHPASGISATTTLMLFSGNASSTQLSVFSKAYFGGTATSTFDSAGNLVISDTSLVTSPVFAASGASTTILSLGAVPILKAFAIPSNTSIGLGSNVLSVNTGVENVAIGPDSIRSNTSGGDNTAVGVESLFSNVTGSWNAALGAFSLFNATRADSNVALGGFALYNKTSATGTVAIGYYAGGNSATASKYNTLIGYQAGFNNSTGNYNIALGQNVDLPNNAGDQQLNIGNLIYGSGIYNGSSVSSAPVNGTIGIGTSTPWAKLSVHANNGDTNTTLFAIASSTASATTTLFSIDNTGNATLSGTLTVGSCVGCGGGSDAFTHPAAGQSATTSLLLLNGGATTTQLTVTGGLMYFTSTATTTVVNNNRYAWTIATSTTGQPLFRIDTTSGSEQVTIGSTGSDVTIGDVGQPANLVFEENSTIKGQTGGRTLTFGGTGDKINFAINTGFGSTTPWAKLSIHANNGDTNTTLFAIASSTASATSTLFAVDNRGNVGIGTSSPASLLTVVGGGACFSGSGATLACGNAAGNLYYRTANTGTYDVAEKYQTGDASLSPGDVVALDTTTAKTVKRASGDTPILGVVSSNPGLLLGGADAAAASSTVAVALSGRVPVKVSLEGGAIAIGDDLSLSSMPGVAMKAGAGEATVGYALESFDGPGVGVVDVFVTHGTFAGASMPWASQAGQSGMASLFSVIAHWLADAGNGIADLFAGNIHAQQKLCVGSTCITPQQFAAMVAAAGITPSADSVSGASISPSQSGAPVIAVQGDNPAHIAVGSDYVDLGAIITGPTDADKNLGVHTFVDGVASEPPAIDTSVPGTHAIDFVATNASGTATTTRTVIVGDSGQATSTPTTTAASTVATGADASSTDATTTGATSTN